LGIIRGNYNKMSNATRPASDFRRRMGGMQRKLLRREVLGLARQTSHRRYVASEYRRRIQSPAITHPVFPANVDPVFSRYPMFVENKNQLLERAREARVELAAFYDTPVQPLSGVALQSVGYEPGSCPNAERAAARVVSLPTGLQVDAAEIERAVAFLNERGIIAGS
jgi:dTDP-4-amino-4,6-dideoxygalactose transaminase